MTSVTAPASSGVLEDLTWRGLIADSTDLGALRSALDDGPITLYCGFDPTAPSLHVGTCSRCSRCVGSRTPVIGRWRWSVARPG